MLQDIERYLACPLCMQDLTRHDRSLRCPAGHSFDVAKQGYVSLLAGDAHTGTGDTAEMVAARADFLAAGHYRPIADALAEAAASALAGGYEAEFGAGNDGLVADLGAGTGHYLAHVLDALPGSVGAALDISKYALRRAAKAHPRIGAVVCDAWRPLPLRDASAELMLNVFAPRNGPEIRRALRPGGTLLLVSPTARHLGELVDALGLLSVDEEKQRRIDEKLGPYLTPGERREVEFTLRLGPQDVRTVVGMGPSAWHTDPERLGAALAALPEPVEVTASVTVAAYRR
ncbi:23S rRNA m(1)G-748 methyltransferase [Streptomyces sp. 1114.5]|uniref:putative RNA methyltransferase n=1 Tax=unclassified Streptomyces TaxID=2593676 RepID=UPI000BD5FF12|nr:MULTISPECIES: methyltransferase domain-containing protein [unclassified Streptomyces]RKT17914.1 23S rRNA m(1)G-748 methyltransferase [Streptomyces sp. 1114.5]SOB84121.1 23S rRNA m(1)G-748 methyltransferase [Streptomyces sp. 1331.2]